MRAQIVVALTWCVVVAGTFAALPATASGQDVPRQTGTEALLRIRSSNIAVQRAIADGRRRSETFRRLVEAVERSSGIVYILREPSPPSNIEGYVACKTTGPGPDRYVWMTIKDDVRFDPLIIVLGHEFQHVLEILEDTATCRTGRLHARAWRQVDWSRYESEAAEAAGDRIANELGHRVAR